MVLMAEECTHVTNPVLHHNVKVREQNNIILEKGDISHLFGLGFWPWTTEERKGILLNRLMNGGSIHRDHTLCRALVLPKQSPCQFGTILDGSPLRYRIPASWHSFADLRRMTGRVNPTWY